MRQTPVATLLLVTVLVAFLAFRAEASLASASPAPAWSLKVIAQPTSFSAADNGRALCEESRLVQGNGNYNHCDRYGLLLTNIGTRASSGPITVTDTLPVGLIASHPAAGLEDEITGFRWNCTTAMTAGRDAITCTTSQTVEPLTPAGATINIPINVEPSIPMGSSVTDEATVTGGEAQSATGVATTPIGTPPTMFEPVRFSTPTLDAAGGLDTQAGDHP